MLRKLLIPLMSVAVVTAQPTYKEAFRPQFHFSPPSGWTNDPNGLVYHNGYWELFYQFNEDRNGGGLYKSWGHARSRDLFHWETDLPVAIKPYNNTAGKETSIFSGSAIADVNNVTGLTPPGANSTLIAFYTAHEIAAFHETQDMAYSVDGGIQWTRYDKNPAIDNTGNWHDFRDPKVSKYNDKFIMMIATGYHVRFYESHNLIDWQYMSNFSIDISKNDTIWECADLFKLGDRWVLVVNHDGKAEYFVGEFDGRNFTSNGPSNQTDRLYLDFGPNSYAGVTYESAPNGRRVFLSWLPGFRPYASLTPSDPWRGAFSIPRELSLVRLDNGRQVVSSQPVQEIAGIYDGPKVGFQATNIRPNSSLAVWVVSNNLLDMRFTASGVPSRGRFGIKFAGKNDNVKVYHEGGNYFIDRTNTQTNFSADYELVMSAPRLIRSPDHNLRVILDVSSIEVFIDGGLSVLTAQFFSREELSNATVFFESPERNATLAKISFSANRLRSVWH